MAKTKMICITGKNALHKLNESAGAGRYILEGVFAELDKLNRNSRIYTKEEYLKHLQYLRDDIRKGEPLLGELDHPEDRFEVKLKEASHRIIDIWYDQAKNVVMGKIELLNTPNGKLAQSIVDQGIPLHISSRAAGTVNSDNTVSIQQIYTYDLVCKPGFAGAVLHRVNESANTYSNDIMGFLHKTNNIESINEAVNYGLANDSVMISEVSSEATLRKEAIDIINENNKIRDIMKKNYKPINEADDFADIFGGADTDTGDQKDDKEKDTEKEDGKDNDEKDDDKKDDGVEILSITPEYASDSDGDSSSSDEDGDKDADKGDEEGEKSDEESAEECDKGKKPASTDDMILDDKKQTEEMTKGQQAVVAEIDKLIKKVKENAGKGDSKNDEGCTGGKCESLVLAQYPISRSLNESNFAQFSALSEEQKTKVTAYLQDRGIYAPKMINEMWKNGIDYNAAEPVWLKYAPAKYKSLYNEAPQMVKESLAKTAEYLVFESQRDVNLFWENSGLETKAETMKRNKAFTDNLPKINESANANNTNLPYSMNLINAVVEMASVYN
jgi:hypothetical protein